MRIEETEPHYQLILERKQGLDELTVEVEAGADILFDEIRRLEQVEKRIEQGIEDSIALRVKVRLVEPRTIARSTGKAKRLIDKRELK